MDAEAAAVDNNPTSRIGDSYSWANLSSFSAHGGKLIFYHGVSDPWFSAKDTIDYYQRMTAANGGEGKVKDLSRLFLSPGMGHCQGLSRARPVQRTRQQGRRRELRVHPVTILKRAEVGPERLGKRRVPA